MNKHNNDINTLLNYSKIPASDITHILKNVGTGDMLNGLKNIYSYAYNKGVLIGSAKTASIIGTTYIGYILAKKIIGCKKKKHNEQNRNEVKQQLIQEKQTYQIEV